MLMLSSLAKISTKARLKAYPGCPTGSIMQTQPQTATLYDADFYAWTQQQAEYLRSGTVNALDFENLAEEIESLGRQERQELRNRLGVLLGHLLKWHYQPQRRSRSWFLTIEEQRERILENLEENPSLKPYLREAIIKGYKDGLRGYLETRLSSLSVTGFRVFHYLP